MVEQVAMSENKTRMLKGEYYYAFTPELVKDRRRCSRAVSRYNNADAETLTRRRQVEMWRE